VTYNIPACSTNDPFIELLEETKKPSELDKISIIKSKIIVDFN